MNPESKSYERPEVETDFPLPETELQIIESPTREEQIPAGIIIGPDELDEDNLPGSEPLPDEEFPEKPHLNS